MYSDGPIVRLVILHRLYFAQFLHLLSLEGFFLLVPDGRRLFKVFPFFPFPNNPLFLYHSFKPLQRFFKRFSLINSYVGDRITPFLYGFPSIILIMLCLSIRGFPMNARGLTATPDARSSQ